jgi:glycosyltransferase involved in cell wall biosynthesis
MMISTMLPVRTCVRFHSPARLIMRTYGADDRDYELTGFLEQVAINRAHVRLASSSFLAAEVVTRLDVPPPVHVVPNGIDLGLFDRDEGIDVVERFGLPAKGDAVTILFTSRLERRKGVHLLPQITLEILQKYPQAHFAIAGADNDGVLADTIRPQLEARGLGDRLHYFGQLPLPEVRALVKHVDIHLLPTLWDNAPYACIEAMASGRAVLSSDCGGLPELIGHGENGLLAQSDDAASFVAALEELIEDRALRERLGDAARRTVEERYTDVAVARLTVDVWRRAITSGP